MKISLTAARRLVAERNGFRSWNAMFDHTIDHNDPLNTGLLIATYTEQAYDLFITENELLTEQQMPFLLVDKCR